MVKNTDGRSCISLDSQLPSANFLHNTLYARWVILANMAYRYLFLSFFRCKAFQVLWAQIPYGMFLPDTTCAPPVNLAWMPALYSQTKSHQRSEQVQAWILSNAKNSTTFSVMCYSVGIVLKLFCLNIPWEWTWMLCSELSFWPFPNTSWPESLDDVLLSLPHHRSSLLH